MALEEPEIRITDPIIPIDNNCTDHELHSRMSGGSGDYQEEGDESYKRDVIPTASWHRWAAIELKRFDLGTSDVDRYEGKDGDDADADEEEEASQADDRSTQGMED